MTGAQSNPTGYRSCQMCHYTCTSTDATQTITCGGKLFHVCDYHAENPIPNPREPDFGPAPDNGTETSSQSARQSDKDVTPQAFLVLGVIAATGASGLTREEIYQRAGISNQAACARLKTLQDRGLIVTEGERFIQSTRRRQQIYILAAYAQARAAA